ncbi:hypothetical protein ACFYZ4_18010 [Streptomyces sp. NPDC001513]|uniref:hypothetical protein n=1 Tax=Streptomyces sp. NPDC001513 TaxID=3364580 RepID=UPI0036C93FFC
MSHEAVPETPRQTGPNGPAGQAAHEDAHQEPAVPAQGGGAPKGLLQQMEELMAALNADLSRLDADLQSSTDRTAKGECPSYRPS